MLWSVKKTASFLNFKLHQVYYLLQMGYIEAIALTGRGSGQHKTWRIVPESVIVYKTKLAE